MKRVLYFTTDFSSENIAFAKEHGLLMRNLNAHHVSDTLENADFACGDVPEAYKYLPTFDLPKRKLEDVNDLKQLKVDEIKTKLTELGVNFEANAKKEELLSLLTQVVGNGGANNA